MLRGVEPLQREVRAACPCCPPPSPPPLSLASVCARVCGISLRLIRACVCARDDCSANCRLEASCAETYLFSTGRDTDAECAVNRCDTTGVGHDSADDGA
eukprot:COSAG05_NODE_1175_length_5616_cov_2.565343_3_plen_100_part_00